MPSRGDRRILDEHPHPHLGDHVAIIGFLGGQELLIIAIVLLVLFGGTRIPSLMRGMGQGIREFRKEIRGTEDDDTERPPDPPEKP